MRDGIGVLLFVFPLLEPWIKSRTNRHHSLSQPSSKERKSRLDKPTGEVTDAVDPDDFGGTALPTARVSLNDPGGGRSTDNVMASASLDDPGGGNGLSSPSVKSTRMFLLLLFF